PPKSAAADHAPFSARYLDGHRGLLYRFCRPLSATAAWIAVGGDWAAGFAARPLRYFWHQPGGARRGSAQCAGREPVLGQKRGVQKGAKRTRVNPKAQSFDSLSLTPRLQAGGRRADKDLPF